MNLTYQGKTKDVYKLDNGNILLKFKDDVTGENGVFDPGANTVGLTIEGAGKAGLRMTTYFFQKLMEKEIPTHFIDSNIEESTMTVKEAKVFGKGLEVICRFKAVGSFLRRYGAYCEEGQPLDAFVEVTIKDDDRQDPPISKQALSMLSILSEEEYETLQTLTQQISQLVKEDLATKGLELYDIKLEFGRDAKTNEIILIDEISGGNMRVYKDGQYIEPLALETLLFS
ncbi:phosphoribosylaminoimidazolesuccinocarboxamide synthase [Psychrobacillus lasiicapitis]|uniref:phosphoribosylaminoimidazolesuccinocarboxamide synthase n=1 Tax=Psychrobacillus lasiicapitis TaxID=1636719 RepID=A0A544T991_9BACI|nr:phosphoribosylaminoimidazolesuccinocarboxamide synthase [Psychrobacillus lasiicapitis]TQR14024.1 phosphoribosylaminoimidazolesuccinocarboxamide synthase [Psychrobacillus lasiicapitis]GGA37521.1 phosphoribosylaminoimidazolesuccinocarboxamide synthase [Psychrobacillus lasiicapitis]